ncbi:hypothetical protein Mapa_015552 [Marchantia paleacea]|nr:hypothetical protein Mapa_015552 [Marchantia paleacea]
MQKHHLRSLLTQVVQRYRLEVRELQGVQARRCRVWEAEVPQVLQHSDVRVFEISMNERVSEQRLEFSNTSICTLTQNSNALAPLVTKSKQQK